MIRHDGFTLRCESMSEHYGGDAKNPADEFHAKVKTERTAITQARSNDWFIGKVRITNGLAKSKIRSIRRVLCPQCKWLVGA